jgi:hypothetical protein
MTTQNGATASGSGGPRGPERSLASFDSVGVHASSVDREKVVW